MGGLTLGLSQQRRAQPASHAQPHPQEVTLHPGCSLLSWLENLPNGEQLSQECLHKGEGAGFALNTLERCGRSETGL